jgi:hypothetical protein
MRSFLLLAAAPVRAELHEESQAHARFEKRQQAPDPKHGPFRLSKDKLNSSPAELAQECKYSAASRYSSLFGRSSIISGIAGFNCSS